MLPNVDFFNYLDYEFDEWNWKPLKWEKLNDTLKDSVILAVDATDYPYSPATGITIYFKDKCGIIKALNIESENLDVICADIACKPKGKRTTK